MLSNIYIIAHKPDIFTKLCIESIFGTATPPFRITVVSHTAYAAANKNTVLNIADTDKFFLVNDDIQFITKGWDELLMESLNHSTDIGMVAPVVRLPREASYQPKSTFAPKNCLVTNVRMSDCVLAMRCSSIRLREKYIVSQGDDIDFMLENIKQGLIPAVDTRVLVKHMEVPVHSNASYLKHNEKLLYDRWGKYYAKSWGQDPTKFVILKEYSK